jgi:hypothetical protein
MVSRMHSVLGTPPQAIFDGFRVHASHMNNEFAKKEGTGVAGMIMHMSYEARDLI